MNFKNKELKSKQGFQITLKIKTKNSDKKIKPNFDKKLSSLSKITQHFVILLASKILKIKTDISKISIL